MPSALLPEPPQRLARAIRTLRGHADEESVRAADAWLETLPALLEGVLERWELTPERVVSPGGRSSAVALVRQADGSQAALKLLAPDTAPARARAEREAAALTRWNGWGAVRLLRAGPAEGALLLERVHGEMSLRSLPENKAMLESVSVAQRLWVSPDAASAADGDGDGGSPLRSVAAHTAAEEELLRSSAADEAGALRDEALELRAALLADPPERVLLHGDFRQGAVLAADVERARWLAAGPDALVGERAYDLARLVRDRLHDLVASPGAARTTRRRLDKLADSLELDRERLRGWSLYRAVASGVRSMAGGNRMDGELLLEFASWL